MRLKENFLPGAAIVLVEDPSGSYDQDFGELRSIFSKGRGYACFDYQVIVLRFERRECMSTIS